MITVELKNNLYYTNGRLWSRKKTKRDIGEVLTNILFYTNKSGDAIKIIINGVDETEYFKKEVKDKYQGTNLQESFFKFCNINGENN